MIKIKNRSIQIDNGPIIMIPANKSCILYVENNKIIPEFVEKTQYMVEIKEKK